jgi:P-type Cu2+ transporter
MTDSRSHPAPPPEPSCRLCGAPVADPSDHYCCSGCRRVADILAASGYDGDPRASAAYLQAVRTGLVPATSEVDDTPETNASTSLRSEDRREVRLNVSGLWCPSCSWLIEEVISREPGVDRVRANFLSDLVEITYDPAAQDRGDLARRIETLGYGVTAPESTAQSPEGRRLLVWFGIAALLTANVMALSYSLFSRTARASSDPVVVYLPWILAVLAGPVVFGAGAPMISRAWRALMNRGLTMDTLIAAGAISAYSYSLIATIQGGLDVYYDGACALITFRLLGRLIEQRAFRRASAAAEGVRRLLPRKARLMTDGEPLWAPALDLVVGDRIRVAPGERVPVDGVVVAGRGRVSTAVVDGEPRPRLVARGDPVPGGSSVGETALDLEVTAPASESLLHRIADHVSSTTGQREDRPELADLLARFFLPFVIVAAAVTAVAWFAYGLPVDQAFGRGLTVLVVSCPCALGIAAPLARVVAAGTLATRGIIIRGATTLERIATARTIAFDKTGTLTEGRLQLLTTTATDNGDSDSALRLLAALELRSNHPIAEAARRGVEALEDSGEPPETAALQGIVGRGVTGRVAKARYLAGRPDWVEEQTGPLPEPLRAAQDRAELQGNTVVVLGEVDAGPLALFAFGDPLRAEAPRTVARLQALGLSVEVLSGDMPAATSGVAKAVGAQHFEGRCLPEDKATHLADRAKQDGAKPLFVGDGINDAPALAEAIGVAVASGTDFARETADVLLLEPDLETLPSLVDQARWMRRVVLQNLSWAAVYNAVAIPAAVVGLLTPVLAAAAMVSSGILVTLNALRLRAPARERSARALVEQKANVPG